MLAVVSGWSHRPEPERWPPKVATYLTIARDLLRKPGTLLKYHEFVAHLLHEEGIEGDAQSAWMKLGDDRLRVAEIAYLAMEALNRLVADGEAIGMNATSPPHYSDLAGILGWDEPNTLEPSAPQAVRASVRLLELAAARWEPLDVWAGVTRLMTEARQAYAHGLYVASAAAARVAAEQAVLESPMELAQNDEGRPHEREDRLFDATKPGAFKGQPLDHSATRAQLSSARSLGNAAAHEGAVPNAAMQESLMQLLPQALVSLASAVKVSQRP